jgi:hypothetical protein
MFTCVGDARGCLIVWLLPHFILDCAVYYPSLYEISGNKPLSSSANKSVEMPIHLQQGRNGKIGFTLYNFTILRHFQKHIPSIKGVLYLILSYNKNINMITYFNYMNWNVH